MCKITHTIFIRRVKMNNSELTRDKVKQFREDFMKLNHALELKYGMKLELGSISFRSDSLSAKVTGYVVGGDVDDANLEELEFKNLCHKFGMRPEDYGREFESCGRTYKLIGFLPKAKKYPYIGLASNGTKYKLPTCNFI